MTITEAIGYAFEVFAGLLGAVMLVYGAYCHWRDVLYKAAAAEVHAPPIKILRSER